MHERNKKKTGDKKEIIKWTVSDFHSVWKIYNKLSTGGREEK